jgi:phospholipid/cholesterol/gamma-HCH transport system ATP-binding protein
MGVPFIRIENLSKSFGENHVIRGVDLDINRGEILTLIGKSGVGKSILLKLLISLIEPDAGRILYEGRPLDTLKKAERKAFLRKMSYVFQGTALLDSMTVFENIALPLQERSGIPREEIRRRVREKMDQLDLADIDEKYPSQLSGGMKKRVALARALVTEPEVVLFDEPTTGLDPIRKHAVHNLITDYQKQFGFTAVLVSHEIPDVFYISQRIAMLEEGRIIFAGTPEALQQSPDPVVQQFIGGVGAAVIEPTAMAHPADLERCFCKEMDSAEPGRSAFTLICLTLDNLAEVNRRFGFMSGQTAMKNLLERVHGLLRPTDTCARVGLNKIMVILSGATIEEAAAFGAKLGDVLKQREILAEAGASGFCLAISAGFAEAGRGSRLEDLLGVASSDRNPLEKFNSCSHVEEP